LVHSSAAELNRLRKATTAERLTFLCDTRAAHARLYQDLTPKAYPEYAGTYRGTVGTALEDRNVGAPRLGDEQTVKFVPYARVEARVEELNSLFKKDFGKPLSPEAVLNLATRAFLVFGGIHPFLDGNGHIQRLMFATIILEYPDLELCPSWTIHPRPFGEDFALTFEEPDIGKRLGRLRSKLKEFINTKKDDY
jgi:fido (protein-threonine AMPylation protein)